MSRSLFRFTRAGLGAALFVTADAQGMRAAVG